MIRAVMLGRLGNNLFQYALGRVLAEKHGVPFTMDGSWFNKDGWDQVKCIRQLPGPAAGKVKIVRRCSLGARALLKATGKHYWEYRGVPILREREQDHSFSPHFLSAPADCMLYGYFQTPLYFRGHEEMIRQELTPKDLELGEKFNHWVDLLRTRGSVAIHVRRTDYTGNPNLDVCGAAYYRHAIARMQSEVQGARFFLFSDDPAACAGLFQDGEVTVVSHPEVVSPLVDLYLMSLANHHIIANSSYSWWAAWLGTKPDQRVMLPAKWFDNTQAPIEEKRLAGWNCIR